MTERKAPYKKDIPTIKRLCELNDYNIKRFGIAIDVKTLSECYEVTYDRMYSFLRLHNIPYVRDIKYVRDTWKNRRK
jgi:hypothetical protein